MRLPYLTTCKPHRFVSPEANIIYKVSLRDIPYPCGKREALIYGNAVSSLSTECSSQNLLCVKAASHKLGKRCGVLP